MAAPIEMIKSGDRVTVYSEAKADALVADGWQRVRDLSPEQQADLASRPPAPWRGYDEMNVEQVLTRVTGLGDDNAWRAKVLEYEKATKNRKGIVTVLGGPVVAQEVTQELPPVTIETVIENPLETIETVEIVDTGDVPRVAE